MTDTTGGAWDQPLRSIVWELTLRCNALCRLCGSSAPGARSDEIDAEGDIALGRELVELGLRSATLSGGEPLLKKGFFDIARSLVEADVRTDIVSNGLLIDEEMAARLADVPLYGVSLSFDGPEPVHDDLRGIPGCWGKVMRAVEALHRCGLPIGALTHVNRTNLHHLPELAEALAETPVHTWRLQLTVPVDDTPETHGELLQPEELLAVQEVIRTVEEDGRIHCRGSHSIGYYGEHELNTRRWTDVGPLAWRGCPAGRSGIGLTSAGDVYGCLSMLMHGTRFRAGNVRKRSLTEIWRDPASFAYNRGFDPAGFADPCASCRFLERCRGGCLDLRAAVDPELRFNDRCLYDVGRRETAVPGLRAEPRRPSVVLLVVDGLRPDFLGCYGATAGDTPNLDALAAGGLIVEHARSGAPWTAPAVASLFTGVSPHRLGVVKWEQPWRTETDLFRVLAGRGYQVGSFPFDRRHLYGGAPQAAVAGLSWYPDRVEDWMVGHHRRPSLTTLHWWGTHAPYLAQPQSTRQWIAAMRLICDTLDRNREFAAKLRELYRMAIRHLDDVVIPSVVRAIEAGRGWENTVLAIVGDHGESWCERYPDDRPVRNIFDLHGTTVYEEVLRVPMILTGAVEPGVVSGPATLMDLSATLARLAGAPLPAFPDGADLADLPSDRALFAINDADVVDAREIPDDPAALFPLLAMLRGDQKLIRHAADERFEWYDLSTDPGETRDLVAAGRTPPVDLVAELTREWSSVVRGHTRR